jgi:hypothetical protein
MRSSSGPRAKSASGEPRTCESGMRKLSSNFGRMLASHPCPLSSERFTRRYLRTMDTGAAASLTDRTLPLSQGPSAFPGSCKMCSMMRRETSRRACSSGNSTDWSFAARLLFSLQTPGTQPISRPRYARARICPDILRPSVLDPESISFRSCRPINVGRPSLSFSAQAY